MSNVDPKILAAMQEEVSFIQSQQRGGRRIKLDKGHTIVVRFLPARLGPRGLWYARIARHWLNKGPIICPRLTSADYGGNPEFDCPVCTLAAELNDDGDKDVGDFGYKVMANPQYLTYCLLMEKDDTALPMKEVVVPYEFLLSKTTWEELKGFYQAGGRKAVDSVLDYRKGNDFHVSRGQKGYRLDKLDAAPIFDEDENFKRIIEKIEKSLKTPKISVPTKNELEAFADKVHDAAMKASRGGDDERPRRRFRDEEDEAPRSRRNRDEEADEPVSRRRASADEEAPAPRRRAAAEEEADEPAPRRSRAAAEEEADDPAPRRRPAAVEEEADEPAPRRARREEPAQEEDDVDMTPSRRRPAAEEDEPAPRRRAAAAEEEDPAPRRRAQPEPEDEPAPRRSRAAAEDADPGEGDSEPDPGEGETEPDPEERPARG